MKIGMERYTWHIGYLWLSYELDLLHISQCISSNNHNRIDWMMSVDLEVEMVSLFFSFNGGFRLKSRREWERVRPSFGPVFGFDFIFVNFFKWKVRVKSVWTQTNSRNTVNLWLRKWNVCLYVYVLFALFYICSFVVE